MSLKTLKLALLACCFSCLFSNATANDLCPTTTTGLCDVTSVGTEEIDTVVETYNDGSGIETITTITTTVTTDTVTHGNSGNILDKNLGYTTHDTNQNTDPGGKGSAMNNSAQCRSLGTSDICAGLTSTNLTTYEWNNLDVSGLSMEGRGGEVTYSVAIDVPTSDTTSITITGINADGTTVLSGTDVLSAVGTESIGIYEGSFDFSDNLSRISIKMSGTNYQLTSAYPVFDDLHANIYWNIVNTVVTQFITSETEYLLLNPTTDPVELELVEDFYDHHEVNDTGEHIEIININEEPIHDITFETVELELEQPMDLNLDLDLGSSLEFDTMGTNDTGSNTEMDNIEISSISNDLEEVLDIGPAGAGSPGQGSSEVSGEIKVETEEVKASPEPKKEPHPDVKKETEVEAQTGSKEALSEAKNEPTAKAKTKAVVKKATSKQKNEKAAKIIKKMGDKGKYDSRNQQKVVIMVALLGADLSTYTKDAPVIEDTAGFDFGTVIPDGELPSNNLAMYLMDIGSSLMMNEMIDSQWKD